MFGPSLSSLSNSLKLSLDERTFFLRPSPDPENVPADDPLIRGSVTLCLARPKRIKAIIVRLVCDYLIDTGPDDYRSECGHKTIAEVRLQDDSLERIYVKGEHTFGFTLIVPSSTAPYERCIHGTIEHNVVAIAEGDGLLNTNLDMSIPVMLTVNPAPIGETSDFHVSRPGFKDELGPYSISTSSQHLTVGGLISFDYQLASVPSTLNIISATAFLNTTYRVKSMKSPETELRRTARRTLLFEVNDRRPAHAHAEDTFMQACDAYGQILPIPERERSTPGAGPSQTRFHRPPSHGAIQVIPPGGSFQITHLARLPPDNALRPSTLPNSKTPIEINHELVLRLQFSRVGPQSDAGETVPEEPLVLSVNLPITLSSCSCTLPSILVPTYSKVAPNLPTYIQPKSILDCRDCVCWASKADLMELGRKTPVRLLHGHPSIQGGWGESRTTDSARLGVKA